MGYLIFLLVSGTVAAAGFAYAFYVTIFYLWRYRPVKPILALTVPPNFSRESQEWMRREWSRSPMSCDYHVLVIHGEKAGARVLHHPGKPSEDRLKRFRAEWQRMLNQSKLR